MIAEYGFMCEGCRMLVSSGVVTARTGAPPRFECHACYEKRAAREKANMQNPSEVPTGRLSDAFVSFLKAVTDEWDTDDDEGDDG